MHFYSFPASPFPFFSYTGEAVLPAGARHMERSTLPCFALLFVTAGALHLTDGGIPYTLKKNEGLLLPPFSHHFGHLPCEEETPFYWLHFEAPVGWSVETSVHLTPAAPLRLYVPAYFQFTNGSNLIHLFRELARRNLVSSTAQFCEREALFLSLLSAVCKQGQRASSDASVKVANQTADYCNRFFAAPFTIEELAHLFGYHPTYLSRCMREVYGVSAKQYLQRLRLEHAKTMLQYSSDSVEEIAERCGFTSLSLFSRSFMKHVGLPPTAYRSESRSRAQA